MDTYRDQPQYPSVSSKEEDTRKTSCSSSDVETKTFLGVLSSPSSSYQVQSYLGEGTFGKVAKCLKTSTNETVAVKIIKHRHFTLEARNEVNVLRQLGVFDGDRHNFVRFFGAFVENGKICLEFEMLDVSLWDYLENRPGYTLTLKEIRPILYQMGITLQLLKSQGIVHSDLKPDNIMLVDHRNQPMKIKMIDFGLARDVSKVECGTYMQPRYYRAPEIIVGSSLTTAIDMWSLGCVAAELFLGYALYPGTSEYDMIRRMVQTQGQLPQKALDSGLRTHLFFEKRRKGQRWRLKSLPGYGHSSHTQFSSLDDFKKVRPIHHLSDDDTMAEDEDLDNFVELLKQMLHLDLNKRITPSLLLKDPFVTMTDLTNNFPDSFYVKSSCEIMEVCQDSESNQQPSTSTTSSSGQTTPIWHSYKEHPAILSTASDMGSSLSFSGSSAEHRQLSFSQPRESSQETPMMVDKDPKEDSPQSSNQPSTSTDALSLNKDARKDSKKSKSSNPTVQTCQQKRKREILDEDGSTSPDTEPGQRRKRSQEKEKTASDATEKAEEAPVKAQRERSRVTSVDEDSKLKGLDTGSPERRKMKLKNDLKEATPTEAPVKAQRKRSWVTSEGEGSKLKEPDTSSPERKKMKLKNELIEAKPTEAEGKPQRKRRWGTYVASHSELRGTETGSPEKKKMKLKNELIEATPTEAPVKAQRKRTWGTYVATHSELRGTETGSPEKKKMKLKNELIEATPTEADNKPQRKRTWGTYVATHSELRGSETGSPERKKMKLKNDLKRAGPTEAEGKPQRKRSWVTSEDEDCKLREPDTSSPQRKKVKLKNELKEATPTEADNKPQRKRSWGTYVATHSELRGSETGSPKRKKMKLKNDLKEAPFREAEGKPQRKRSWGTFKASHSKSKELQSDSPEEKKMKMSPEEEETDKSTPSLTEASDDSKKRLPQTKPSCHAMTLRPRKRTR